MVQQVNKFSDEEKLRLFLHGTNIAMNEASADRKKYIDYSYGEDLELTEDEMKDMELLEILESLGYSINELGTYLYKDVIKEAYKCIKDLDLKSDDEQKRAIISSLTDAFSGLYHYIARECKEMGVKSFHLYIQKSIDKINYSLVDKELSTKIFGDQKAEQDYGMQAFQIASYVARKHSYDDVKEYRKPMVKKLSNMPNNLRLKDNF